jgi:3-hydroxyisobutyrate dehydrogenase-like beta-hydroxyacid dehydrogenase
MRIGFIGLGYMGAPMAGRLVAAAHDVRVFNRSAAPVERLAAHGAVPARSAGDAAQGASVVLTALPTPAAVEAVYAELATSAVAGQVYVDHSTVALATSHLCAGLIRDSGADFLDAPVSGGPEGAEGGTLAIMVGGREKAFQAALPVLEILGTNIYLCGETGAGTAMKLVNQLLVGVHTLAAAEAYTLAVTLGLDPDLLQKVIGNSYGASRMFARNAPRFASGDFQSHSPIRLLTKDLGLIVDEIKRLELPLRLAELAWEHDARLVDAGGGEMDIASVVGLLAHTSTGQGGSPRMSEST